MTIDYTLVLGVDGYHLRQLEHTWPTWMMHKYSLLSHPLVVFYDLEQVSESHIAKVLDHPDLKLVPWPLEGLVYGGEGTTKWNDPHRAMMLSGFVYVPALYVNTKYWLKLDTDVVATGVDDWIDPSWFEGDPAIISHRWNFTKPANQMLEMDAWVEGKIFDMPLSMINSEPLNLAPEEGSERLSHKRIISWCGFFNTRFTLNVAKTTMKQDETFELPVASQDGFLWYMATRIGRRVVRADMKSLGWEHWSTMKNVQRRAKEVMDGQ